jgi:hypothetical protein
MTVLDQDLGERRNECGSGTRGRTERSNALGHLDFLAELLDTRWKIPGTSIRFGADALFGLVPVVGDLATAIASIYIVIKAREHGASSIVITRMVGNVALDTVVGSVPILGSIFDVYFKANKRNIRLLRGHLEN